MKLKIATIFVLVLCLFSTMSVWGQVSSTLYYNKTWMLSRKETGVYYRTCTFDTVNRVFMGQVQDFTMDGKALMTGSYSDGKRHGLFVSFYENGRKAYEGPYEEGLRNGSWTYYHRDGSLKYEVEFIKGAPGIRTVRDSTGRILTENGTGVWTEVYDETRDTRILVKGQLIDHEYDGAWTQSLPDGTVFTSSRFSKGQFLDGYIIAEGKTIALDKPLITVLPEDFKYPQTESLALEAGVSHTDYPFLIRKKMGRQPWNPVGWNPVAKAAKAASDETVFVVIDVAAHPIGGLAAFYKEVAALNKYPKEARRKRIQGKVFVEFVVNKDGSLSDIKVIKGIGGGCDEAALHAVEKSQKNVRWIPGIHRRKFARQRYTLPIIFKLG